MAKKLRVIYFYSNKTKQIEKYRTYVIGNLPWREDFLDGYQYI